MINPDSFKACINDNYYTYFPIINQSSIVYLLIIISLKKVHLLK